jgi:diacylglycerol kinase
MVINYSHELSAYKKASEQENFWQKLFTCHLSILLATYVVFNIIELVLLLKSSSMLPYSEQGGKM